LAFLFVQGGYNKLFGGTAGTVATMASHGIPYPGVLVWGAVVVELGVGLCLMAGLLARWAALILAAYTLTLGLIFHAYWLAPAAEARFERIIFFNHLSVIGGMLIVVAFGAGCLSLDALIGAAALARRPRRDADSKGRRRAPTVHAFVLRHVVDRPRGFVARPPRH
jgi:putative oxidoreductase